MKTCNIENCSNKHHAKGYCGKHYQQKLKTGSPNRNTESHGLVHSKEYNIWSGMKQRCYNRKVPSYGNYGGRGIIVCDRWRHSFILFLEDMELPRKYVFRSY